MMIAAKGVMRRPRRRLGLRSGQRWGAVKSTLAGSSRLDDVFANQPIVSNERANSCTPSIFVRPMLDLKP